MKKKIVVSKTEILIFFLMLPIIKPESLRVIAPVIESLFDVGRVVSALIILTISVGSMRRKSGTKSSLWILVLLEIWIVFVTALNNPSRFLASVINGSAIIAVSMLIGYYANNNPIALLKALMANFEWVIYANLITQILVPEGLYQFRGNPCYFLGLDNSAIIYILPAVTIAYLYYLCLGKSFRPFLLVSVSIVSIIIGWCATSVVGLITITIVWFFLKIIRKSRDKFKLIHIWIISIVIDLLITVVRIMDTFAPLRNFIVNFLGKSTTLTGRTYVWDQAMLYWARSPVLGNGYYTILPYGNTYASHAHNAYLQYLLISGVIGLSIFIMYNFAVIRNFDHNCGTSTSGIIIKASFAVLFITFITEACNYPLLFSLYSLAECIPVFISLEEKQEASVY